MEIVTINGGFRVPKDSHVGKWIYETGKLCHDEFTPYSADPFIKTGDTVIDVGSFVGDHTIHYSDLVGQDGKVLAVEPGKIAFECLEHNVNLFRFRNTVAANYGVSDVPSFAHHVTDQNLGASSCIQIRNGEVMMVPLHYLFKMYGLTRIDFIKIDAEGYEMKVLNGSQSLINRFKPTLMLEINQSALQRVGNSQEEIFDFLGEMGYGFFCVNGECRPNEPQFDVICECLDHVH